MNERLNVFNEKMEKSYNSLTSELATIRAGRANPHVLDKLTVDYYDHQLRSSKWRMYLCRKRA